MLNGIEQIDELIKNYWNGGKAKLTQENFALAYKRAAAAGNSKVMQDMDTCAFTIDPAIKKEAVLSILEIVPHPILLSYLHAPLPGISAQMQDDFKAFAINKRLIDEGVDLTRRKGKPSHS